MPPEIRFQRNGLLRTAVLFRRASVLLLYKYPELLQISHALLFYLLQMVQPLSLCRSLCKSATSGLFFVQPLHMLHESCGLPAIRILWNEGTVWLSSPSEVPNTTDSILSEGHGKTVRFLPTGRRTESLMSDGCTLAPEESQDHLLLPMQLPVQILRYDRFPSGEGSPGSALADIRFQHLSL